MPANTSPKVFISYAHSNGDKGEQHKQQVLAFANQLRSDGVNVLIDQQIADPEEGWPLWMNNQLETADIVLLMITETYSNRIQSREKEGIGKGCKFEGRLVYTAIHESDSRNNKFLPVLFHEENAQYVPLLLKGNSHYVVNNPTNYETLLERIFNLHQAYIAPLGDAPTFEEKKPTDFFSLFDNASSTTTQTNTGNQVVKTSHLPTSNYNKLFGRETEIKLLNNAWNDPHTRIISLIAWGGVGKTALINEWLQLMNQQGYHGATHVLGYSFYSQGSDDDRQVSSDAFFTEMFRWLAYRGNMPNDEHTKGELLADLIARHKILLVLDGLEPLQWPSSSPEEIVGQFKDPAIKALLRNLADKNDGLVVISSRLALTDLQNKKALHSEDLQCLSESAGVELLKKAGVTGPKPDLKEAVNSLEGHALSLNLLASYLVKVHNGDVRRRDLIQSLRNERTRGAKANQMLLTYVNWLTRDDAQQDAINAIALNYLHILGLFDRPVTPALQIALLTNASNSESIAGVTDQLASATHEQKQLAIDLLRQLKLIDTPVEDSFDHTSNIKTLDCHPLIRDYFANRLKDKHPDQYTDAHTRLYEYYKALPEKELPDTLEEMQPLFAAVAHGCKAGLQQKALDEVYWPKIRRSDDNYVCKKLGAFAADLACIAQFFEHTWDIPSKNLSEQAQNIVLNWAAFRLRGLSRLADALHPFEVGFNQSLKLSNYHSAASNINSLSELYLSLGKVPQAIISGSKAVEVAGKNNDWVKVKRYKTTHSIALFNHAQTKLALEHFRKAEQLQQRNEPELLYLYSIFGFRYCIFFLAQEDWQEVTQRAKQSLNWVLEISDPLSIALEFLSLGNAYLQQAQQQKEHTTQDKTKGYLDNSVQKLHKTGRNDYLVYALLARANYYTFTQQHQTAWKGLQEAFEIAHFGGMRLFLTEYHLLAAENLLTQLADNDWVSYLKIENDETLELSEAALHTHLTQHLQAAEALIEQTDYQLKIPALSRLQYEYAEQTLSAAAFKQQLAEDSQLQAGKKEIERQHALVSGNKAVYACREILADIEHGEIEVTEQLKAEFLQQLSELKQQVEIADDFYRRPIMAELAVLSIEYNLATEDVLQQNGFAQSVIEEGRKVIQERKKQEAIRLKELDAFDRLNEIYNQPDSKYTNQINEIIERVNRCEIYCSEALAEVEALMG